METLCRSRSTLSRAALIFVVRESCCLRLLVCALHDFFVEKIFLTSSYNFLFLFVFFCLHTVLYGHVVYQCRLYSACSLSSPALVTFPFIGGLGACEFEEKFDCEECATRRGISKFHTARDLSINVARKSVYIENEKFFRLQVRRDESCGEFLKLDLN